jgi:large subunit ribosomal protein L22
MAETFTTPTARAGAKHLRVSPYKVRQVLSLVRGLPVDDAVRVLQLCEKDAAGDVLKILDSAIANAENNNQLPPDEMYVARAYADEGPTRKWGQPRARGRYFRVRHRSSHVTIIIARYTEDELEQRRRREEATGATAGGGRSAQRRRAERVRRSRAAQRGEHDHEHDHDHEEATDEVVGAAVGPASEEDVEATAGRDEELAAADEAVDTAEDETAAGDDAATDDDEESK